MSGTKIVKKGANRAAHAEKVAKHAQRQGAPGVESSDPAVEAGVDAAYEAAFARIAAAKAEPEPEALPKKVAAYVEEVRASGWETSVARDGDAATVTSERDGEVIRVTFVNGGWSTLHRQVFVRRNGSEVLLRNASAAKKQASGERVIPSETARVRRSEVMTDDAPVDGERAQKDLPFDPATISTDDLAALLAQGAKITWQTKARVRETGILLPGRKVRIAETPSGPAGRALTFVSMPDGQYRSLSLRGLLRCDPLTPIEADEALTEYRLAFQR